MVALGEAAVALNADGTLNGCANPAMAGSTVTVFVDGLGPVTPALATGTIAQAPAVTLTPGVGAFDSNLAPVTTITSSLPGATTGVVQVQLQLPPSSGPLAPVAVTPTVLGNDLRERLILIWARSN